jgi:spermidine synthase
LGVLLQHQKETPYGSLKIVDIGDTRYMLLNGSFQGEMNLKTGLSTSAYIHLMAEASEAYAPSAQRALSIGLGGGCLATMLQKRGLIVDMVEIDGDVISASERFFSYRPGKGSVIQADGRRYLVTTDVTYDVVLLDAFASEAIPEHLLTAECFKQCKDIIGEEGLLAVNLVGFNEEPASQVLYTVYRTVKSVFPHTMAWWIEQPADPDPFGNLIILASPSRLQPVDLVDRMRGRGNLSDQMLASISQLLWPEDDAATVLTDQYNPLAAWNTPTDLKIRRKLLEYLPPELLIG